MFIPSAKSMFSLLSLTVISIILFIVVENSKDQVKSKYYDEKLAAAQLMFKAINVVKEFRENQKVYIDDVNDPAKTSLIGERNTLITTDRGNLTSKLTTLNPNFAAVLVEMLKDAGLQKKDKIAMSCTGSFPALNIAVYSACKVLDLDLITISSVGSSMFGANDPDFTWLDMETLLYNKGIFQFKSIGASLGGGRDLGRGLNKKGRDLALLAIERNNLPLIKGKNITDNIQKKMKMFKENTNLAGYQLYINVGGGLSSLGTSENADFLEAGFNSDVNLKNINVKGTAFLFAENKIPVINLLDIKTISNNFGLPIAPDPLPVAGTGNLFLNEKYNLVTNMIALFILVCCIGVVIFFDNQQMKLKESEMNR